MSSIGHGNTGSTDDSRQIAERHGARVFDVPWRDDFAAARNEALERARGRFVLYIDADERLCPVDRAHVDGLLADESVTCYTVLFRPQIGYTRYRVPHLDPAIAYDERIFGVWPLDALGLCCWRLGRYAESARWYARAEAAAPGDGQYRAKRRLAEARLGRK